jgi:hypothetical protein
MSRDIYEKACNGDWIDNMELAIAIKDYAAAEKALFKLGPPFEIARKAITMTLITLEGFQQARKGK